MGIIYEIVKMIAGCLAEEINRTHRFFVCGLDRILKWLMRIKDKLLPVKVPMIFNKIPIAGPK